MTVLRVLSLGGGVQSTTLALMMKHGEVEPADHAIYADVPDPEVVKANIRWLMSDNVKLPFPIHVVSVGSLLDEVMHPETGGPRVPAFCVTDKAREGRLARNCTRDHKIVPIQRKIRDLLGLQPRQRVPKDVLVEQVVGISWDEKQRAATTNPKSWIELEYPLIQMRMTRGDCLEWMKRHGYPEPPRSACTFCPNRKNEAWRWLRDNDPDGFQQAVEVDRAIRNGGRGLTAKAVFLHRQLKPLDQIDLTNNDDLMGNLFADDCQGGCGL